MLLLEIALSLAAVLMAIAYPEIGAKSFEAFERRLVAFARRPVLSVLVVGLLTLVLRAAVLPIEPIPEPIVHDEFGYLLAADTFAHGRLTNPTHPMWVHFETFSIIQKPSYQCFAQPAQGLILALGQLVGGHPFWGVWLSAGIMCSAICWMLQGWLPPEWALLGGSFAIIRFGVFSYWANSYWGGAVGAIGGALVLGALPRLKRASGARNALVMGLGLAILANSRPYEGLILSLPVAIALFAWMAPFESLQWRSTLRTVVLPLCLTVAVLGLSMGYYCWRVTGEPFRLPYQAERQQYAVAPYMLWQSLRTEPTYHHEIIRRLYAQEEVLSYNLFRTPVGAIMRVFWAWKFYVGPVLSLPFLTLFLVLPFGFSWKQISSETQFLLITLGITTAGLELETFWAPHYFSPSTSLIIALVLVGMRCATSWRCRGKESGLFLVRAATVICIFLFVLRVAHRPAPGNEVLSPAWNELGPGSFGRASILSELSKANRKQLVLVRYKPGRHPFEEWVYNDADIDASTIVWAREMAPGENDELFKYFSKRNVWLLEADQKPPTLVPYRFGSPALAARGTQTPGVNQANKAVSSSVSKETAHGYQ